MLITILGGGGFIGSTIADKLLLEGYQVRIFERPGVAPYRQFSNNEKVEWVFGDLLSVNDVENAVRGANVVLHLVSTTLPKNSNDDPLYDVQSNIVLSLNILNSMVKNEIKKIIFISSGGTVYGRPVYLPIDEDHPTNPLVSYGITKLAIEKYLQLYESLYGIKSIILRVANPYGERQRTETAQGAIGVFLNHTIKGIPINIWGDGTISRDYIHVSDVAEVFLRAIHYDGMHRVFNVSSGVGTTLEELLTLIEAIFEKRIKRCYLPGREFDVKTSILSNRRMQKEFGYTPIVSLEEGIARTIQWAQLRLTSNDF